MRKFAHTLSEVLIALGVSGLLGAVVIPKASKFRPDTDKIKFLRVYDSIVKINDSIVYDNEAYPLEDGTYSYEDYPLFNTATGTFDGENLTPGKSKYCQILASLLAAQDNPTCLSEYEGIFSKDAPHFSSKDGMDYWVYTQRELKQLDDESYDEAFYKTDVYVDINGAEGVNCRYGEENCSQPDRFRISIKANGETLPDDDMGGYYLNNRSSFRLNRERTVTKFDSGKYSFQLPKIVKDDFEESCEQVKCPNCQAIAKPGYRCSCGMVQDFPEKCKKPINPCKEYYCSTCLANGDGAHVVQYGESCPTCGNAQERPAELDLECTEFLQNPCEEGSCPNCKKIGKVATQCTTCTTVIPYPDMCRKTLDKCENAYCEYCISNGYGVHIVSVGEKCEECRRLIPLPDSCIEDNGDNGDKCLKMHECTECGQLLGIGANLCKYCGAKTKLVCAEDEFKEEVKVNKCKVCEYLDNNCDPPTEPPVPMSYRHTCLEHASEYAVNVVEACKMYYNKNKDSKY